MLRWKCSVKSSNTVSVKVIHNQNNLIGFLYCSVNSLLICLPNPVLFFVPDRQHISTLLKVQKSGKCMPCHYGYIGYPRIEHHSSLNETLCKSQQKTVLNDSI